MSKYKMIKAFGRATANASGQTRKVYDDAAQRVADNWNDHWEPGDYHRHSDFPLNAYKQGQLEGFYAKQDKRPGVAYSQRVDELNTKDTDTEFENALSSAFLRHAYSDARETGKDFPVKLMDKLDREGSADVERAWLIDQLQNKNITPGDILYEYDRYHRNMWGIPKPGTSK